MYESQIPEEVKMNPPLVEVKIPNRKESVYLFNNDCFSCNIEVEQLTMPKIAEATRRDEFLSTLALALQKAEWKAVSPAIQRFVDKYSENCIYDEKTGIVYIDLAHDPIESSNFKIFLPRSLIREVLVLNHSTIPGGHHGARKTLARVQKVFYAPRMSKLTHRFVKTCRLCQKHKGHDKHNVGRLRAIPLMHPFHTLHLDWKQGLPMTKSPAKNRNILVVTDLFSGFLMAFPTRKFDAQTLVTLLIKNVFPIFGLPRRLVSDSGGAFISKISTQIYKRFGIKHSTTCYYNPRANAPAELQCKKLGKMIAKFCLQHERDWDEKIPLFVMSLNSSVDPRTGYSPAFLNLGREIEIGVEPPIPDAMDRPVEIWAVDLTSNLRRAINKIRRIRKSDRTYINAKLNERIPKPLELEVGQKCWVRAHYLSNKSAYFSAKLAPRFLGPYIVAEKISPLVYKVREEATGLLQKGFQHINNLRPVIDEVPGEFS